MKNKFYPIIYGVLLALLTLFYAEFMATSFGLYEEDIKSTLLQEAMEHTNGVTIPGHEHEKDISQKVFNNREEAEKTAHKAWVYLKRAHSHAEGMGAMALVMVLLIAHTVLTPLVKKILSIMIGIGAFTYPLCLFYAGIWMVDKGKVAAKADVHYVAISSVAFYLFGITAVFFLIILSYVKSVRNNECLFEAAINNSVCPHPSPLPEGEGE